MSLENGKEALVIHYFLTEHNNTSPTIAKKIDVDLSVSKVNAILTKYLKNKTINE